MQNERRLVPRPACCREILRLDSCPWPRDVGCDASTLKFVSVAHRSWCSWARIAGVVLRGGGIHGWVGGLRALGVVGGSVGVGWGARGDFFARWVCDGRARLSCVGGGGWRGSGVAVWANEWKRVVEISSRSRFGSSFNNVTSRRVSPHRTLRASAIDYVSQRHLWSSRSDSQ
jgi:hypothetical protein